MTEFLPAYVDLKRSARPSPRRCFCVRLATIAAALALCHTSALAKVPIYKQEPYDLITLNAANENKVLKVVPLGLSPREIQRLIKSHKKTSIRLFDTQDKEYELSWRSVVKVETFLELVIKEADELVAAKKFDDAYDYYYYLLKEKPDAPGLDEAFENALQAEVRDAFGKGKFDSALALLYEMYRRNPEQPGLDRALGRTVDELVGQYIEKKDYASARTLLRFPLVGVSRKRRGKELDRAVAGRSLAPAGASPRGRRRRPLERGGRAQPPNNRRLARVARRPRIGAGNPSPNTPAWWSASPRSAPTSSPAGSTIGTPAETVAWCTARCASSRAPASKAVNYICPVGEIASEALGQRMAIKLKSDIRWATGNQTLDNVDVVRRLLAMALPDDADFRLDWADLIDTVSLRGPYGIVVELRRAHVRPEAMLQFILTPQNYSPSSGNPPPTNGPFVVKSRDERNIVFLPNEQYFAAEPGQPSEVIERRFDKVSLAVRALKHGEIDVVGSRQSVDASLSARGGRAGRPLLRPAADTLPGAQSGSASAERS